MWEFLKKIGLYPLINQIGRLFNGEDWYQSQIGNKLSGAQREANVFTSQMQEDAQAFNSAEAAKQRQFQIDFYNQIQSPQAQIDAFKKAGINPAAVFGNISAPSAAGGSAASSSSLGSVGAGSGVNLQTVVDLYFQKERLDLDKRLADAEVRNKDSQTMLNNIDAQYRSAERELGLEEGRTRIQSALASIQKQMSDIDVNNSTIEVNGQRIRLLDSEVSRTDAETILTQLRQVSETLDIEKAQALLPYIRQREEAEIELYRASSQAQRSYAIQAVQSANLSILEQMKEKNLLDSGYYDTMVKQAQRDYKWTPVNNVARATSQIVGSVLGITSGAALLGKAGKLTQAITGRVEPSIILPNSTSFRQGNMTINYR